MKQFFVTVAGVLVGLLLFFIGVPAALLTIAIGSATPAATPADSVLALDLRGPLTDQDSPNPFAASTGG